MAGDCALLTVAETASHAARASRNGKRQQKGRIRATRDERAEERLIQRCREGDAEACAVLVRKYASLIYSVPLHSFGMSQDDADDIYQLCFIKVLQRVRQFRGDSRFSAWLRTVVRNICVDCMRSQKQVISLEELMDGCESCPLSEVCSAEKMVRQAEERQILEAALASLPDRYRLPLTLFFLEERSYKEISEILGEPLNTVGTHINRGLARLRKVLASDADALEALTS
ncbi:MAG: sigma-24 [Armatimonadota bacterium]|nr:MAG: sigma-24 [Armatimonadota bacterium]